MKYPATHAELVEAGFVYEGEKYCSGRTCRKPIYWYRTPGGRPIPMSRVGLSGIASGDTFEPHFASCPDVEWFRRPKKV